MTEPTRLDRIMAETLVLPADEVPQAAYGQTPSWDSVAHLLLMAAIEEHLGVSLAGEDVSAMTDHAAIRRILSERYGVSVDG